MNKLNYDQDYKIQFDYQINQYYFKLFGQCRSNVACLFFINVQTNVGAVHGNKLYQGLYLNYRKDEINCIIEISL